MGKVQYTGSTLITRWSPRQRHIESTRCQSCSIVDMYIKLRRELLIFWKVMRREATLNNINEGLAIG